LTQPFHPKPPTASFTPTEFRGTHNYSCAAAAAAIISLSILMMLFSPRKKVRNEDVHYLTDSSGEHPRTVVLGAATQSVAELLQHPRSSSAVAIVNNT